MMQTTSVFQTEEKRTAPKIFLRILPNEEYKEYPRPKTVLGLLQKMGIRSTATLVIREGRLLTPDQPIAVNDKITLRIVMSSG